MCSYSVFTKVNILVVNQLLLIGTDLRGHHASVSSQSIVSIVVSGANEVASEVVDVTFLVHQVLLFFSLNLDPFESFGS